jgi:hypothetical protein
MRSTTLRALLALSVTAGVVVIGFVANGFVANGAVANGVVARSPHSAPANAPAAVATPVNGETVGVDPLVSEGQLIAFSVDGFAPGAMATLTLECQPLAATSIRVDAAGAVRVSFTLPALAPAGYLLSVSGPSASVSGGSSAGVVDATIPRAAFYPFEVTATSTRGSSADHQNGSSVHGRCTGVVLK